MTTSAEILTDAFWRIREVVERVLDGLDVDQLAFRVEDDANPIAWLVWHLTRLQDASIAGVAAGEQQWISDDWATRFALPFSERATGYGQSTEEVDAVRVPGPLLLGYHDAVYRHTIDYLEGLGDEAFDRVVDVRYDPPVTLAVRLVSIVSDEFQHAGQAAFLRGIIDRRR